VRKDPWLAHQHHCFWGGSPQHTAFPLEIPSRRRKTPTNGGFLPYRALGSQLIMALEACSLFTTPNRRP